MTFTFRNGSIKKYNYIYKERADMKKYKTPTLEEVKISNEDILNGSDVLINGEDLFGPQN